MVPPPCPQSVPRQWIWATGSRDGNVVLKPAIPDRYDGTTALFSPDAAAVLTIPYLSEPRTFLEETGRSAAVRIWDAGTGALRVELKHPYVRDADFSPDGKRVVTAGDDRAVVIWDAEAGTKLAELQDHEREVVDVEFSRDGKWFATAGRDDTVRIRAAHDGKTTTALRVPGKSVPAAVVFSPDSRWLLTLSRDDPPRLWDWQGAPGSSMAALSGPAEPFHVAGFSPDSSRYDRSRTTAAFSPDGSRIATGTAFGQVLVHACEACGSVEALLNLARSRVSRSLTPEERSKYRAAPQPR